MNNENSQDDEVTLDIGSRLLYSGPMVYIYALCDTHVRYVGATSHLGQRLASHMCQAGKTNANVSKWLASLKALKKKPVMRVLEKVPTEGDWEVRERHWISTFTGEFLLNQTIGGKGTPGYVYTEEAKIAAGIRAKLAHTGRKRSPEARERMRQGQLKCNASLQEQGKKKTHKPPSEETRHRISAALTGRKASPETREKLSKSHQNPSPELREKWATAARQRDPEWKAWFAQCQAGKSKSEETRKKMSDAAKARWEKKKCTQG